ncbi:MAG: NAD(P)H-dependent glycerol-3-phosphate dehydrogenase [Bacteroidales bacterium]|nr:NAD(P)H-dependent glycerol-3-phosphate dehydrogenase [Bacteroidales bacterium]
MIGLLGSGTWATAIVSVLLEDKKREINWWVREPEIIEGIRNEHCNPVYLSETELDPDRLHISGDINEIIAKSDEIFVVVPSVFIHKALSQCDPEMLCTKAFCSAVKGIIPETNEIVTDYLHNAYGIDYSNLCIVSGPSHAEEVGRRKMTFLTVASSNNQLVESIRGKLECKYIHTTASNDIQGIQYATAMKNIYAVASGIFYGLGYGDNMVAVLTANALKEMESFVRTMVPDSDRSITDLAYLGDLLVTAYSQFSRNRTFGYLIGYGRSVAAAQLEMKMVAEGYYAVKCIEQMRKTAHVPMPIEQAVYQILHEHGIPSKVMKRVIDSLQ